MKLSADIICDAVRRVAARILRNHSSSPINNDQAPLRSELFSTEQMERRGKTLAGLHRLSTRREPDQLLARLADNEYALMVTCNLLTTAVKAKRRISPAGEWLLDNFYLIEEQIRTAKRHFPAGYSRELPRLDLGPSAGLPRVYDIALEAISHGDGRVDAENLLRFITAYQTRSPLKLGELWAIPIMLRLALIENLRRVGARVAASTLDRDRAHTWADQMLEVAEKDPKSLILVVADMARSHPPMGSSFVAELARRLQGQSAALALPLTWIEQRLSESGFTIEQLVQSETQNQASGQVSISNSIGSLRSLGAMDWRNFVESMSRVEQTLREDPAGIYDKMDFATRDRYRHAVEKIAKASLHSEIEVASKTIELARSHTAHADSAHADATAVRAAHVGFYLVDDGLPQLMRAAGIRPALSGGIQRVCYRWPLPFYLGAIASLTCLFSGGLWATAQGVQMSAWIAVLMAMLLFFCSGHLAIALVNWLATLLVAPRPLPRLDFSNGIPPHCRTLVVVPTMLTSEANMESLVEALEVRFLANRDDNLLFGLLTDFRDAQSEIQPDDERLLLQAGERIKALNEKYRVRPGETTSAFFLFHRPRRWNAQDQLWMGHERKRGKLTDLNALLRGHGDSHFLKVVGAKTLLAGVKYVITLDTDTQLPRDTARQFVGAMAHPLNRAHYDDTLRRVTEGYGILQPRMAASLPGANRSRYARLFGSEPGIDPYTRVVSDVYQDVFGEGSFIGKGIYDVDAFERALGGQLPENRILSHDLLEGCYARAALLSDVQLYEEYPLSYDADVRRRHRWIRGDWQIASWLLSRVPGHIPGTAQAGGRGNPLSTLSQWKILDNLRRSLVPPALTLLLLLGWTLLPAAGFWILAVMGILLVPALMGSMLDLFRKADDIPLGQHLSAVAHSAGVQCSQALFTLACLPYEAYFSLDAIVRTNWRIFATKKRLMEWTPSETVAPDADESLRGRYRAMWVAPAAAAASGLYLAAATPGTLSVAGPILLLWTVAPAIAWWISRPLVRVTLPLSSEQIVFLRKVSRKTWAFFETFVGKDDHWLPPDNHQEHPVVKTAHRTSPTNMGLSLLATLSAHDFGYIPAGELVDRTASALQTMATLERHRGHFYNWYDTQTLQPLAPLYISSVDSGNLAGHLLTLRAGLLALPDQPILGPRIFEGIADTLAILDDSAPDLAPAVLAALEKCRQTLQSTRAPHDPSPHEVHACLDRLVTDAEALNAVLASFHDNEPESKAQPDTLGWARALARQCLSARDELTRLAPMIESSLLPTDLHNLLILKNKITLRELIECNHQRSAAIERLRVITTDPGMRVKLDLLQQKIDVANQIALQRMSTIDQLVLQAGDLSVMEYGFLYDETRHLLAIGFNVTEQRRDASYYDLLASEARLCSFVAIAQGQVPQESWFALGRQITPTGGKPTLLSWSGSMFEYLMPLLVMPTYENTLLDCTYRAAVERQIVYGFQRGVAWGISECGYHTFDAALNYQYRAFGVPGLGLKRGLAEDLVIAPYASALALMVAPEYACMNLQRLAAEGLAGPYGFYEAADYTVSRLPRGQSRAIVRSFMAHHQGMIFLSLSHLLLNRPMQRRFDAEPMFRATNLLLQERIPKLGTLQLHRTELSGIRSDTEAAGMPTRVFNSADTPKPEVQLLSNGRYHVMITNAGGVTADGGILPSADGAKTRPATTGEASATSAMSPVARSGRTPISPRSSAPKVTRPFSRKDGPNSGVATTTTTRIPRLSSLRKTT